MMNRFVKMLATLFYLGYIPVMPGTIGSLAGLLLYISVKDNIALRISLAIFLLIAGFFICQKAFKIFEDKDDKRIIFDEFCAMPLAFLFLPRPGVNALILGFALYRVFDITKPFGIKRAERLPAGWGVLLDDVIAAMYTAVILVVLHILKIVN